MLGNEHIPMKDWKADPDRTSQLHKAMTQPIIIEALKTVERSSPIQLQALPLSATTEQFARMTELETGYRMCLNHLCSLTQFEAPAPDLEEEFAAPELPAVDLKGAE